MIDAYGDPGTPDARSGRHYLWWLVRRQAGRTAVGALLSSVWMALLAVLPYLMSRAIDDGLAPGAVATLAGWAGALLAVGAFNAWLGIMRHRTMTRVRMDANFRTVKVVVDQAVRLGAALRRRAGAGEIVTIGVGDVVTIGSSLTAVGPGVGAVVGYAVVAGLLLSVSVQLAAVVLLGLPLIGVLVGPLLGRLQGAETEYRERQSVLTARIGDIAGGLRVLNGLGGKGLAGDAFRRDSGRLREQGYRVGAVTSWVQSLGVGLPTLFAAVVTWLAARQAVQGRISVGELVSVYGYVAVLVGPVAFMIEMGQLVSRGLVAARRVTAFLRLEPAADDGRREAPVEPAALDDPESGVRVLPGRLTVLAGARPADAAAVVDRLGRYTPSDATWGGIRLDELPLAQIRKRILVADAEADLFAGTLREILDTSQTPPGGAANRTTGHPPTDSHHPRGAGNCAPGHNTPAAAGQPVEAPSEAHLVRAVHTAVADDIVRALPAGLASPIDAQGRNLSGGQRQRVRLARALAAGPEVLFAVEPTSALDAHTEATVADRLRQARAGRTTVLAATSPLLLDRADVVHYLVDGKVTATGSHRELLDTAPGYRALVSRDAGPAAQADADADPDADMAAAADAGAAADAEEVTG
ncbi:ABC transporter ATP-binding protein [Streptomyces poriticola]|uniref:ABC transporter ATP-binding protein n=1 Tax=Streptomyces poriticola TaxID=3120506 RepID=UPI002FCE26F2